MAETGFSHRLTAYKIVGHFFGMSYRKRSGSNQSKKSFYGISNISIPCPHAQLRGRTVLKMLWTFLGPRNRSQSPPCWIFWVKQIHPSTASERTTRQEFNVNPNSKHETLAQRWFAVGPLCDNAEYKCQIYYQYLLNDLWCHCEPLCNYA